MTFQLPNLPYELNALEPNIDAKTMEIHHGKHHATYVAKLNDAVKGTAFENQSIEAVLQQLNETPESIRQAVRNNGGGHANHSLFWSLLTPNATKTPVGELATDLLKTFGSLEAFQEKFAAAAANRFGSGWAWLIVNQAGELEVTSTPNQDSPLMPVAERRGIPVIGLDVWEHAYYLNYQNRRPDYISAFWNVLNWEQAEKNYQQAKTASAVAR